MRARVRQWRSEGVLDAAAAERVERTLEPEYVLREHGFSEVPVVASKPPESAPAAVVAAPAVTVVLPPVTTAPPRAPAAPAASSSVREVPHEDPRERAIDGADDEDAAVDSAGVLFAHRGASHAHARSDVGAAVPLAGALGAFSLLDADHDDGAQGSDPSGDGVGAEVRGFLYENVGWFIGVLLVLAGSVYGVREAWRTLDGVARHAVVASALLGYHGGFTGLARLLAPRSRAAGAVLSAVAVGLLPMVFASLAAMVAASPFAGLALSVPALLVAFFTARAAGTRFGLEHPSRVSFAVLPSLVASLPLAMLPGESLARWLLPFAGTAAVALTFVRSGASDGPVLDWPAVFSGAYAAVALLVLSIVGAPDVDDAGAWLASGGTPLACVALFAAAFAAVFADGCGRRGERVAHPRAAPAGEVLALGVLASAAVGGAYVMWSSDSLSRGAMVLSAGAGMLATGFFARASLRHPGAAHATVWLASLAAVMGARVVLPAPSFSAWWYAAAVLGPAGSLVCARLLEARSSARTSKGVGVEPREAELQDADPGPSVAGLVAWGWLLGPLPVVVAAATELSLGFSRWFAAALAGAVLTLCAAWSGGLSAQTYRRHYLAGLAGLATAVCLFGPAQDLPTWARAVTLSAVLLGAAGLLFTRLARVNEGEGEGEASAEPERVARDRSPYDDLSLATACTAVLCAIGVRTWATAPPLASALDALLHPTLFDARAAHAALVAAALPSLPVALLLFARAQRDRSRLVSVAAAVALVLPLVVGGATAGAHARVAGVVALACAVVASLRGREGLEADARARAEARSVFGVRFAWVSGPRALALDGFAVVSLAAAALALARVVQWISALDPSTRGAAVAGGALVCASTVLWFFGPSLRALYAQGRTLTLVALAVAAAATGVANRLGRPLTPAAVSVRFAVLGVLLWLVAWGLSAHGARLAKRLEAPAAEGGRYHLVPHAGVAAFALICLAEAALFGAFNVTRTLRVVPPMLWFAGAISTALLANSARSRPLAFFALIAALPGAMALAVQRSLLGDTLVRLLDEKLPGGPWVLERTLERVRNGSWLDPLAYLPDGETEALVWQRGLLGAALVALAMAAVRAVEVHAGHPLITRWLGAATGSDAATKNERGSAVVFARAGVAAALVVLAGFFVQTWLVAAAVLLGAAVLGLATRGVRRSEGAALVVLSLAALLHAHAQSGTAVPDYAGPALAALAVALSGVALRLRAPWLAPAQWLARGVLAGAVCYALAPGAATVPMGAAIGVVAAAVDTVSSGAWLVAWPPGVTVALASVGAALFAVSWARHDEHPSSRSTVLRGALRSVLWALFAAELFTLRWALRSVIPPEAWNDALGGTSASPPGLLLQQAGSALALVGASVAFVAHGVSRALRAGPAVEQEDPASGMPPRIAGAGVSLGRDVALVSAGALAAAGFAVARAGLPPDPSWALTAVLAALGIAMVVSAHAAWREASARHVYFVQASVVGAYAGVRALVARGLDPAVDALAALGFGFILLGVTVLARRAKIAPVAIATRRFAAWLPVLAAVLLPSQATNQAAVVAAVAGALYGSFAVAEQSRWLGTLAGVFINGALLVGALANGLDGVEVYLAPLGLFVLTLGQLFRSSVGTGARAALRIAGGLLLYLPAGLSTALQLGDAATGAYAVAFGAACLAGVALGALLRIRAYLVLGALFLTLDVGANLAYAGLRDHRVGFAVLSGAGLLILGGMVASTLQRAWVRSVVARVRRGWSRWE